MCKVNAYSIKHSMFNSGLIFKIFESLFFHFKDFWMTGSYFSRDVSENGYFEKCGF